MILSNCHNGFEKTKSLFIPSASISVSVKRFGFLFGKFLRSGSNHLRRESCFRVKLSSQNKFLFTAKNVLSDFLENIKRAYFTSSRNNSSVMENDETGNLCSNISSLFNPKKIIILTKLTRLEFERRTNTNLTEKELESCLKRRGSDYSRLLEKYNIHTNYLNTMCQEFEKRGIEYKVLQRWEYNEEIINWADAIFTAGGDGTFLLAATKVRDRQKPVIGINTDPSGSEGYMCLMKKCPESQFPAALDRLLRGDFKWLWRQRIRITLSGNYAFDEPIELHDQQLLYPEHRWLEYVKENEDTLIMRKKSHSSKEELIASQSDVASACDGVETERILPHLALNEVFIGESISSRVSYYELQIDDNPKIKQKSSGLIVCTGTGSTSWYFNVNKLSEICVSEIIKTINEQFSMDLPVNDSRLLKQICQKYNDQFVFGPSESRMAYTIRDPIFNATFPACPQSGFTKKIFVKSRCFDAHLAIDGGVSYVFKDGAQAKLEIHDEDALRTVVFR